VPILRVLTDRGTEYCGAPDKHPSQLFLQLDENEFYRVTFRKKVYGDLETLQTDLDEYMNRFNTERTHQGT